MLKPTAGQLFLYPFFVLLTICGCGQCDRNPRPLLVLAGGCDQDQIGMGAFQEWCQVSTIYSPENGVMIDFKGRSVGMNVLINVFWKTKMSSLSSVASLEEFHCIPLIFCSIFQKNIYQGRPGT